jgi:hypothetical protein
VLIPTRTLGWWITGRLSGRVRAVELDAMAADWESRIALSRVISSMLLLRPDPFG